MPDLHSEVIEHRLRDDEVIVGWIYGARTVHRPRALPGARATKECRILERVRPAGVDRIRKGVENALRVQERIVGTVGRAASGDPERRRHALIEAFSDP